MRKSLNFFKRESKIVERYYELFNKHQWEEMAKMYSEKAAFKDPSLGTGVVEQSRAQIAKKYGELEAIFPDVHDSIVQIYPSDANHIVVEFVSTGTAPDNTKFTLPICTIFAIENGLTTKDFPTTIILKSQLQTKNNSVLTIF